MATRKIIKVDLSELDGHAMVLGSAALPEGMLVVREERSYHAPPPHPHQARRRPPDAEDACNTTVLSLHFSLALHEHKHHPFIHEHEHMKLYFIHSMFITCDT